MKASDLRILFVVDAIQGRNGVGTYFQDLVDHLQDRVARVELVAPSLAAPHPCQGVSMPMPGDPTQRLFVPRMRQLTQLMVDMQPHVVVVPGPGIFSFCGQWMAGKLGIPVCVTHQTDYNGLVNLYWKGAFAGLARSVLNWLNLFMFRNAASVASISDGMLVQLREAGVTHPRLVGTPLSAQFIRPTLEPWDGRIRRVLFVGRLAAEKNLDHFLDMARQRPDLSFSVIGDGPLREQVEASARRLDNLALHGWCAREAVQIAVDQHDLLVLPSRVEAFGTVALEAMARARLVMVTPECGISQWPDLNQGLEVMAPGETPLQALERLEAMPVEHLQETARAGARLSRELNDVSLAQWEDVLKFTARQASKLPASWPSPTFALLRRLADSQTG